MPAHKRVNWEFFAVMRGKLAPFSHATDEVAPVADRFWLLPPGYVHGWIGEPRKKSEVIVIHFNSVPNFVAEVVAEHGPISLSLTSADKQFLRTLAKMLKRHYWHPVRESEIHTERAMLDLCVLILRDRAERTQPLHASNSLGKVIAAENWLRDHLANNPSVLEAARGVGLSSSQLNRLFQQVRKRSPQQVLNQLKLDRAMEILGSSNAKLHSVAAESGFSSASNLCRAFKRFKGDSPTTWRQEIYIQYKKPRENQKAQHQSHGRRYRLP